MDFNSDNDITAVVKMVKDYKKFINRPIRSTSRSFSINSDFSQLSDQLSFNETSFSKNSAAQLSDQHSSLNQSDSFSNSLSLSRKRRSDDYFTLSKDEKADIIAAKSKVSKLENDLNNSGLEKKKMRIEEEARQKMLSAQLLKSREESDAIRRKFKQVVELKDSAVTELEELEKKFKEFEAFHENESARWAQEKNDLTSKLNKAKSFTASELVQLREKCARQTTELMNYSSKLTEAELQLKNFQSRHEESGILCQDYNELKYRCDVAEAKNKTLQQKLCQVDETSLLMSRSQAELANYRCLRKENEQLKEENRLIREGEQNMLILNEKLKNQQSKLEKAKTTVELLRKQHFEHEELKKQFTQYKERPKSEGELTRIITELQISSNDLSEKNGELEVSLTISDSTLLMKLNELTSMNKSISSLQNKHEQLDDKYSKLQRRLTLVTEERDGLRRVLASYEADDGKASKIEHEELVSGKQQAQKHLAVLEEQLTETKNEVLRLRANETNKLQPTIDTHESSMTSLKVSIQLEECKKQLMDLQKENETLKDEKENYELIFQRRELQGEYNPAKTRLLQLKNGPAQIAYENYARETENVRVDNHALRKEVVKLKKQLDAKSTATEDEYDDECSMDVSKLIKGSKHMEEIRTELEREKMKSKRLTEQFKKEVKEFREALYHILGYSIKKTKDNEYRVQSLYSTHTDDFFLFTYSSQKGFEKGMVETEYVHEWINLLDEYVRGADSIPAFLASVTLELFSQSTEMRNRNVTQRNKTLSKPT